MSKQIFHYTVPITLAQGSKTSDVEVLRVGVIRDRNLQITKSMLDEYVKNFKANVYGTELQVNLEHNRGSAAAGWIKDLYVRNDCLYATVEWTELGVENVSKSLFKFVSAELANNYPHFETGKKVDNVFIGLALTNTPALKGQAPIALSEEEKQLFNTRMLKTLLADFQKRSFVSKADKALVKQMLDEAPADEKEENKAAADEVAAKTEVDPAIAEAAAAAEKKKKEDDEAAAAKAAAGGNLNEKVDVAKFKEMEQEVKTLREVALRNEVTKLAEGLMISDTVKLGFAGAETKTKLVDFMINLSAAAQTEFVALMAKVGSADLSQKGSTDTDELKENDGDDDEEARQKFIAKCAAKMLADGVKGRDGKPVDIEQAQKMAAQKYKEEKGK